MLQSLMRLFAILATINADATRIFSRNFVETYLKNIFSPKIVVRAVTIFDQYLEELAPIRKHSANKRITTLSIKILMICDEINEELQLKNKYIILFSIIQFSKFFEAQNDSEEELKSIMMDTVKTIYEALMISDLEFNNCRIFITDRFFRVPDRSSLLVVNSMESFQFTDIRHYYKAGLKGQFFFLKIPQADLYIFYYTGNETIQLAGKNIFPSHVYVFPKGGAIKSNNISPLYYSDLVSAFSKDANFPKITLSAKNIDFRYANSDNGIHELNLSFNAGEMIGVMGGSGTGKSTLMGILNGTIKPDSGNVYVNGKILNRKSDDQQGLLGFVPQDDLLIEELSVYNNLYYNAKLCLGNLSEIEINKRIDSVLNKLDLFYIKDLKVGNPLNKYISGGQRKRLNIALELIREPYILFVDEPTSGLSSTDSENVLLLLKEQALLGKIVVINIHQPSSDNFKMFDRIVILDKGGYSVYVGNPLDSVQYLKEEAQRADASEIQCETCGNVHTDEILKIIEAKKVNEFGEFTKERLFEPLEWYKQYKEKVEKPLTDLSSEKLPELNFRIPSRTKQFWIYSKRNFFSKIADFQFVTLSLLIAPLLALILSFFTKYLGGMSEGSPVYIFNLNENIPAYLFMCVIVSLFIGMIISAEDIISDGTIRSRETFLNLSNHSYLNSKIAFLFGLSAIQMLVFIFIGNSILGIRGLNFNYWLILFSTSCFAVMLGLNISAGLKSVKSIYINIPFILVPLILLSGVIVKFDKLHDSVAGKENVPLIGNLMASRWAYEALVVNQFKNNDYEKYFFEIEKKLANTIYNLNFLIPALKNKIEDLKNSVELKDEDMRDRDFLVLQNTFSSLADAPASIADIEVQNPEIPVMEKFLRQWKTYLLKQTNLLTYQKDSLISVINLNHGGSEFLINLKQNYYNKAIEELVLNSNDLSKILEYKGKLIRKDSPVFQDPKSHFGRAQFFASSKFIGHFRLDTVYFDVLILWLMTLFLYIALINDWLKKIIKLI